MKCVALVFAAMVASAAATQMVNDPDRRIVEEINSNPGLLWKAGYSERFNNMPLSAFKSLCGVKADSWGMVQQLPRPYKNVVADSIPDEFDSETNWKECAHIIGDIRDQSMCGCCWAFGGASAASDRLCISSKGKIAVPLSAQDVCFCASFDGCSGGQITTPWDHIGSSGVVTGGQVNNTYPVGDASEKYCSDFSLPHCHHHGPQGNDPYPAEGAPGCPQQSSPQCPRKCDAGASADHKDFSTDKYTFTGGTQSASGEQEIQQAIMAGGPVETAFTVYTDFANYGSGIYHHVSGSVEGGHAVRIVGWGVENGNKYWKVANSWNPYWGEKGYFRIKRGNSECGIEDGVTFSGADATWSKKN
jgi:cathepsin B